MKINTRSVRTSDTSSIERSFGAQLVEQTSKFTANSDAMVKGQTPAARADTLVKTNPVSADVKPALAAAANTLTAIYSDSATAGGDVKDTSVKAPDVKADTAMTDVKADTPVTDMPEIDYLSQIKRA